ncbi:hypothetical protein H0H81_010970 [Sphagnurus paluster]|uniref:GP-PDE domain-containing protein n=1 Tax=Sphagnurus paluster TaxID=117069 RepID=A0A9P7FUU8_9AGAR|nr:hypothetical protein H0H81_010970 [Sphagnurus paluster]
MAPQQFTKKVLEKRVLPDCWGHRGASSRFPENTLASFEAAIRDGAEGIESADVHVSADNVVVMFHDPGKPLSASLCQPISDTVPPYLRRFQLWKEQQIQQIKERNWYGQDGMEKVRTVKEPKQAIPTFAQTVELLMRPENQHANFNVDVKVQNDPDRLFALMHEIITAQPNWETLLAPRILLGLWHPCFLPYAKARLPYCRRSFIGYSPYIARKYFWADCDAFSVAFDALATSDGQKFLAECKAAGKNIMVWTVNEPEHMMEAVRWQVNGIITDVTKTWLDLRTALHTDYDKISSQYVRIFLWTTLRYYTPFVLACGKLYQTKLERVAGPFDATYEPLPITPPAITARV